MESLKLESSTTVLVGDGETDIKAGKQAKVITCAVSYGLRDKKYLAGFSPDFIIDEFTQLKEIFC